MNSTEMEGIAIIGMAGRFPGAQNIDQFWQNLRDGVEGISVFTEEELAAAGIEPELLKDDNYVKAKGMIEDIDLFAASFFGYNPREAEVMDPQQRLFLECAWQALESAAYDPETYSGRIGTYAGAGWNSYLLFNIASNRDLLDSVVGYQTLIGNEKDHLTTRVSYKLNLTGPSIDVQTACSTSLVATSLACQSLLNYQCDLALAGGVTINVPQKSGYLYQSGGILSLDGHCRAFDAKAQGTVIGNGVGVVVLKRLAEAIADGDCIHAVIKGSAINNDGAKKVGYTAPSVNGQAEAIAEAMSMAEVDPESIGYIETHGTGTALGDPIEIAALTKVFSRYTQKLGYCAIGSVKTNIGHLDAAAGVAGLIKTVLALKHQLIPPSLHFQQPNPEIDFANTPFYVNTKLQAWQSDLPRRAGVSSLGIGGTNAHVILEQAPTKQQSTEVAEYQLLVVSAKTASALETATANLVQHLKQHPELNLADVAYTLQVGRRAFNHRRALVCQSLADAVQALESRDVQRVVTHIQEPQDRPIAFMFPGQGSQYIDMGRELYETEPTFRQQVDRCADLAQPLLKLDLRSLIYPHPKDADIAAEKLKQTAITQPALFTIEYALAQLWMSWGISPQVMLGHSIGEYVAACLAGVFSLADALMLVVLRGQLMQQLPAGAMLAVFLPAVEVKALLDDTVTLAAVNAPSLSVVSGTCEAIAALAAKLTDQNIGCRCLHTSHAFHSAMMEPILEPFVAAVKQVKLHSPQIPFISNLTGTWITAEVATDPYYWAQHLRHTVQFSAGMTELLQQPNRILLEVGPGRTLCTFARQHSQQASGQVVLPSLCHPQERDSDVAFLLNILSRLWLAGAAINWSGFYADQKRYRVPLPTYPFERQRYWIDPQVLTPTTTKLGKKSNLADWFYLPSWKQLPQSEMPALAPGCYLVFIDNCGVGANLVQQLTAAGVEAIAVSIGEQFKQLNRSTYTINPNNPDDYHALIRVVQELGQTPTAIAHLWSVTITPPPSLDTTQECGFYSLIYLAQALGQQNLTDTTQILVGINHLYDITGDEVLCPEKATIVGSCKVIPQEYPQINCRLVDVVVSASTTEIAQQLMAELIPFGGADAVVAYRGHHRWVQTFEPVKLEKTANTRLRQKGVYLITGGIGGIGLVLAEYLAKTVQARLVLIGRSGLPPQPEWTQWLATHSAEDATSRKIQQVESLTALGAEVLVIAADVSDRTAMAQAIAQSLNHFGEIHGVIHAAGVAGGGMIQLKTAEIAAQVFAPKVQGTLVLHQVLKDVQLDFFVLCSALSSILGGFGQVDYCAANAFLDSFAVAMRHDKSSGCSQRHTIAINWDAWQEVGMAVNTAVPDELKQWREESLKQGLLSTEAVNVFSRILNSSLSQVVISTQDLPTIIAQTNNFFTSQSTSQISGSSQIGTTRHPRAISGNYVTPTNEIESKIAEIWQQLIGIEQVGIHDNFFELGGHSLLAIQTISRLRETFQVDLPLRTLLFEAPTVAELAEAIAKQPQSENLDQMVELLAEIENISPEEAEKYLATEL